MLGKVNPAFPAVALPANNKWIRIKMLKIKATGFLLMPPL